MTPSSFIVRLSQILTLSLIGLAVAKRALQSFTLDLLIAASGPVALAASLCALGLIRWKRRPRCRFEVRLESTETSSGESAGHERIVVIAITNTGAKPIQLDLQTLKLERKGRSFMPWSSAMRRQDTSLLTLAPGGHCEISILYESFLQLLELDPPERHDEKTFKKDAAICLTVESTSHRVYRDDNNHYTEDKGNFFYL